MKTLFLDFEFQSPADLSKVGSDKFIAEGEPTWIAWALEDGAVNARRWSSEAETELLEAMAEADEIYAHNAVFDLLVMQHHSPHLIAKAMERRLGCTSAMAGVLNLPQGLDDLCKSIGLPGKKEIDFATEGFLFGQGNDDNWEAYVIQDVEACRGCYSFIHPKISGKEESLIDIHLRSQIRGVGVDVERAEKILASHRANVEKIDKAFKSLTGYNPKQAVKVGAWMEARTGLKTASIKVLRDKYDEKWSDEVKQAFRLLEHRAKSEVAKLERLVASQVSGRLRDHLAHAATTTNRWAGRGSHLHNLPREGAGRSVIQAGEGKSLVIADLSQIEVRVGLWLAGMLDDVKALADGQDWYSQITEAIYGKQDDPAQHKRLRHRVKQGVIGTMYSAGVEKVAIAAKCSNDEAAYLHREAGLLLGNIVRASKELWREFCSIADGEKKLASVAVGNGDSRVGIKMADEGCGWDKTLLIRTPANSILCFHNLAPAESGYSYTSGRRPAYMKHRGTLFENIASNIAREVLANGLRRMDVTADGGDLDEIGEKGEPRDWKLVATIHDEVIYEVPEQEADEALGAVIEDLEGLNLELPGLLVNAEGRVAKRWKEVKQ